MVDDNELMYFAMVASVVASSIIIILLYLQ